MRGGGGEAERKREFAEMGAGSAENIAPLIRNRDLSLFCTRPSLGPAPEELFPQLQIAVLFEPALCAVSWPVATGRKSETISGPAILLTAPRQAHACCWEKSAVVVSIRLETRLQRQLLPQGLVEPILIPAGLKQDGVLWQFASGLRSLCVKESACEVSFFPVVALCVARRALELMNATPTPGLRRLTDEQVRLVQDFVQAQLAYEIHADDLAHCVGLSLQYFNLLFKNTLGLTPADYIFESRMQRAKELLLTGNHKIGAVGRLVGIWDGGYFTSRFRAHYGVSPRAMIEQARAVSSVRPKISSERP